MQRVALFAHYDAEARVRPFIVHYLKELRTVCDDVVFVSTSPLAERELDRVRPYGSRAITKENVGFDFGMWRAAIEHVDLDSLDELVITNSSIFGPIHSLASAFETMREKGDAWGMTDNVEIDWHLQSYFLVFRKAVIDSNVFREFWQTILPYRNKDQVIRSYEVGLSKLLVDQGFALRALAPLAELPRLVPPLSAARSPKVWWKMLNRTGNPTCGRPADLLRAGMPFVKVEVLRDNPFAIDLIPVLEQMRDAGWDNSMVEFDRPVSRRGVQGRDLVRYAR